MKSTRKILTADFETTTDPLDCRVWAWGVCEVGNPDYFEHGNTIETFLDYMEQSNNSTLYFHNLKFDSEFLMVELFKRGFTHVVDRKEETSRTFTTLISDKGQFYAMKIIFEKKNKRTKYVQIYDSLKILPFRWMHKFLDPFSYIFQCPGNIADNMKLIYNDCGIRKCLQCHVSVDLIHIRNEILHLFSVRKRQEILHNSSLTSRRKDIKELVVMRICKNCMEFLTAGIALKFINRKNLGKKTRLRITNVFEATENGGNRDAKQFCRGCHAITVL